MAQRLSKEEWIEKFSASEVKRLKLEVVPCYCTTDPACAGWQVVFPNQQPTYPTTPKGYKPCPYCAEHRAKGYQVTTCEDCCGSGLVKESDNEHKS